MSSLTRLAARIAAVLGVGGLTAADRPRWAEARTRHDLGELTAEWLEGRIASQPGYDGPVDVDEHLAPGLTDSLAALNRAGFLTTTSQAGSTAHGQQATVTGFAGPDVARRLADAAEQAGLECAVVEVRRPLHRRHSAGDAQVSGHFTPREIADMFPGVRADAVESLAAAKQVTLYDPQIGRNQMWPLLRQVAAQAREARQDNLVADLPDRHPWAGPAPDDDTDGV
jgi:hypothetical protein